MKEFAPVTDEDLARARSDAAFRQQLLSSNLEVLLRVLSRLRETDGISGRLDRQLREAAELAVRMAELMQSPSNGPDGA